MNEERITQIKYDIMKQIRNDIVRCPTQAEFGRLVELPQPSVSDIMLLKTEKFTVDRLFKLCVKMDKEIDVSINDINA